MVVEMRRIIPELCPPGRGFEPTGAAGAAQNCFSPGLSSRRCQASPGQSYAILGDHRKAEEHFTRALQRKDPGLPCFLADADPQLAGNAWLRTHAALLGIKRG